MGLAKEEWLGCGARPYQSPADCPISVASDGVHRPFSRTAPNASAKEIGMTRKTLFRRVLDSLVEGRSRQAQRYIDQYLRERGAPKRNTGERNA